MVFKKNSIVSEAAHRKIEEAFFEAVALEIADDKMRPGLWAKAIAQAKGNNDLAKAHYIELRRQSLQDEIILREHEEELRREHEEELRDEKPYADATDFETGRGF